MAAIFLAVIGCSIFMIYSRAFLETLEEIILIFITFLGGGC